jgi:hypothetical protein
MIIKKNQIMISMKVKVARITFAQGSAGLTYWKNCVFMSFFLTK